MDFIEDIETLEALYDGKPSQAALRKVADRLTPLYRQWILASRFCVMSTVGPSGTDGTPRGDDGPVATVIDERTLAMPDWRGNNRLDSLRNIVADGRISLLFMVPGSNTVVRVNGNARLTADAAMTARFEQAGKRPRSVIVISISEIYTQCARALIRSRLWTSGDQSGQVPSPGRILEEMTSGEIDGAAYDADWTVRGPRSMW